MIAVSDCKAPGLVNECVHGINTQCFKPGEHMLGAGDRKQKCRINL